MNSMDDYYQQLQQLEEGSPEGELLQSMLRNGGVSQAPGVVLQDLEALQAPWNPVGIPETIKQVPDLASYLLNGQMQPQPSKDTGFFIPEFAPTQQSAATSRPVGYKAPIGSTETIDTKKEGAVWRDTLNVYERTPEGGVRVRQIKDIPNTTPKPTAPEYLPTSVFMGVKRLASIEDPVARTEAMANLATEVERYKVQVQTTTANQIESELGIPRLLEAIAQSESVDRRNPDPILGNADSKLTMGLRQQLDAQRQRAAALTEEQLKRNVTLVGLDTQLKSAENVFQQMEASDARLNERTLQQELRNDAIRQDTLAATSPQAIDRAMVLDPSLQGKDPAEIAMHLRRTRRTPEAFVALEAPPERLVQLSLLEGNTEASKILAHEEGRRTGESPEVIQGKLLQIKKMAEDPKEFQRITTQVLRLPADAISQMARQTATAVTKEDKAQLRARKVELAMAAYGKMQEAEFAGNVQSWAGADPEVAGALSTVQQTTGRTDIGSVLSAYVGTLDGPGRIQKENEFYGKIRAAAAQRNKSLLGGVDSQAIIAKLQRERAQTVLEASLKSMPLLQQAAGMIQQGMAGVNPLNQWTSFFRGE